MILCRQKSLFIPPVSCCLTIHVKLTAKLYKARCWQDKHTQSPPKTTQRLMEAETNQENDAAYNQHHLRIMQHLNETEPRRKVWLTSDCSSDFSSMKGFNLFQLSALKKHALHNSRPPMYSWASKVFEKVCVQSLWRGSQVELWLEIGKCTDLLALKTKLSSSSNDFI